MKIGDRDFPLKRAIGISAVLHLLLAPLLVESPLWRSLSKAEQLSSSSEQVVIQPLRIEHRIRPHRQPAVRPRPVPAKRAPVVVAAVRQEIATPRIEHKGTVPVRRSASAFESAVRPAHPPVPLRPGAEGNGDLATGPPGPESAGSPAPTAAPTAAAVAAALTQKTDAERAAEIAAGGWGQNFDRPLPIDDGALADLRAKYRGVTISVRVDENGHVVKVAVSDSAGGDARSDIVQRLLAMRFVPAECNGLRCAGTLTLTL